MFDISAFVQDWPSCLIPENFPWHPFIPPTLAPEETKARRELRKYITEAFGIEPSEKRLYRGYIAGTNTPEEKFQLDRINGFVDTDKEDVEASGLAVAHAEAEILQQGLRLDLPTRLLNFRYLSDWEYGARDYVAEIRRNAPLHGNAETALLFIEVQQAFEARLIPVVRRVHAAEEEQIRRNQREMVEEEAIAQASHDFAKQDNRRNKK